jgi:hypothetical protein
MERTDWTYAPGYEPLSSFCGWSKGRILLFYTSAPIPLPGDIYCSSLNPATNKCQRSAVVSTFRCGFEIETSEETLVQIQALADIDDLFCPRLFCFDGATVIFFELNMSALICPDIHLCHLCQLTSLCASVRGFLDSRKPLHSLTVKSSCLYRLSKECSSDSQT